MTDLRSMQDMFNGTSKVCVSRKSTPLLLADMLDADTRSFETKQKAAAELRRLHEVNQMLVDAIEGIRKAENSEGGATGGFVPKAPTKEHWLRVYKAWQKANEALVKAKEQA